jgi:HSP20 family molecular chaperone IbpA
MSLPLFKTMFNKKNCPRCEEKIKSSYDFCPSCGLKLNDNSERKWGMLGKKDYIDEFSTPLPSFGGISGSFMNKMIGSAMKMIEKEMNKEFEKGNQENPKINSNTRIRLMVNGKEITPHIKNLRKETEKTPSKKLPIDFSKENLKKFQKLTKKEPKTHVRRIGDKLTYELEVPGVKSINDVSISQMEGGLEVKAVADKKAYFKNISIDLPLIKYVLSKEILSLEMDAKE